MPALGAIGGVDAIVIALVALILLYATYQMFSPLITGALQGIPLIGGFVAGAVGSLLAATWGKAAGWSEAGVGALVTLIQHMALIPLYAIGDTLGAINDIQGALVRLAFTWLPAFGTSLHSYTDQKAGAVQAWATATFAEFSQVYNAAIANEHAWANATFAEFSQVYNAAIATEHSWAADTFALFSQVYNAAIATEHSWAADTFALFSSYYNAAIAGAIATEQADVRALQGLLGQEVKTIEGEITTAAQDTLDQALAHDQVIAGALSLAIAGVATAVQDLERLPCIQECSTLGPFASMLDDIDLAAILALTAAALADPSATTTFVQDQVVPVIQDAGSAAVQLLGIGPGVTA